MYNLRNRRYNHYDHNAKLCQKIAHIFAFGTFACAAYSSRCSLITAQVVAVVPINICFGLLHNHSVFTGRLSQGPLVVS